MHCCLNCFKDTHIRDTIQKYGVIGNCDFCSSKNIPVYEISIPNPVSDKIIELLEVYSISNCEHAKPLKESLRDDWDIFNGGSEGILTLVTALCSNEIKADNEIFSEKVIIPQLYDKVYLNEYGVVSGLTWKEFSDSIKYENRFHNDKFNSDAFASFLSVAARNYSENSIFYRARISDSKTGFSCDEMYSPPKEKRSSGRINPAGIGTLYLSSDDLTVLSEIRANLYDYVTIGKFQIKNKIKIVDLSSIAKMSPFIYGGNIEQFAVNRQVFQEMSNEIAKPLRRTDSVLEYLPTQYISEFVKSQDYDGVGYESTLRRGGYNIALFDESLVECINVKTVEVTKIQYEINDD